MADITLYGYIEGIRYKERSVLVTLSEFRKGYKRSDNTYVNDELVTYTIVFKEYFKAYIASHFDAHMLVKIKGTMLPWAKDKEGNFCQGYTILGETINLDSIPNRTLRKEKRLLKDSQANMEEKPNVEAYQAPDF